MSGLCLIQKSVLYLLPAFPGFQKSHHCFVLKKKKKNLASLPQSNQCPIIDQPYTRAGCAIIIFLLLYSFFPTVAPSTPHNEIYIFVLTFCDITSLSTPHMIFFAVLFKTAIQWIKVLRRKLDHFDTFSFDT